MEQKKDKLQIIQDDEVIIDIVETPWQNLKDLVEGIAKRRRMEEGNKRRSFLKDVKEFDNATFVKATMNRKDEETNIIKYIAAGAW